jgi:hypothetical protein
MNELDKLDRQIDEWHKKHGAHMAPGMPGAYSKARRRALNIQMDSLCQRRDALSKEARHE